MLDMDVQVTNDDVLEKIICHIGKHRFTITFHGPNFNYGSPRSWDKDYENRIVFYDPFSHFSDPPWNKEDGDEGYTLYVFPITYSSSGFDVAPYDSAIDMTDSPTVGRIFIKFDNSENRSDPFGAAYKYAREEIEEYNMFLREGYYDCLIVMESDDNDNEIKDLNGYLSLKIAAEEGLGTFGAMVAKRYGLSEAESAIKLILRKSRLIGTRISPSDVISYMRFVCIL